MLPAIDYLVVGHISQDINPTGYTPGGTALYSAATAQVLGCRTAVLTSASEDYDVEKLLPGIAVHCVRSSVSTKFENIYGSEGRQQMLHSMAAMLTEADLPEQWRRASVVHLGPISQEIDPNLIKVFSNSLIGLTPQGWFRQWDDEGHVTPGEWSELDQVLPLASAVILSHEDIPRPEILDRIKELSTLVILTRRSDGCTVFFHGEARDFPAPSVQEVEPTGAGDIFAAAFFVRLYQTRGNPWDAAEFANIIAACSIEHRSLENKIEAIKDTIERLSG